MAKASNFKSLVLPTELVKIIVHQFHHDQPPEWVQLGLSDNPKYILLCISAPSPLMAVDRRTRQLIFHGNLTIRLKARTGTGAPVRMEKFNYKKDTLYLDLEMNALTDTMSLNKVLQTVHLEDVQKIRHIALCYYAGLHPDTLPRYATPQFTNELDHSVALQTLKILQKGSSSADPVVETLLELIPEPELGNSLQVWQEEKRAIPTRNDFRNSRCVSSQR